MMDILNILDRNKIALFLSSIGTFSVLTMIIGIYSLKAEWSFKKTASYLFSNLKNESEKLAMKNKSVIKAEELGVRLSATDYVTIVSISIVFGIIMAIVFKSVLLVIIGILIGYMLPERIIDVARFNKQKAYLESAIPGVEMIAINNMHISNIVKASIMALRNMKDPFKSEMQQVIFEVNSGKSTLAQALDNMVMRTKSKHLKRVASSLKFADNIGGKGWKMLQTDANLLSKDKERYEKRERRQKKKRKDSYIMSIFQILPIIVIKISLPEMYENVMNTNYGQVVLFLLMVKIIFDFYLINKKTMSLMQ